MSEHSHLLNPYLRLPASSRLDPGSLILVTSILGTSSNWLLLKLIAQALQNDHVSPARRDERETQGTDAILVSFLREWDFWKREAARMGLNLNKFEHGLDQKQGSSIRFVDGLTSLYAGNEDVQTSNPSKATSSASSSRGPTLKNPQAGVTRTVPERQSPVSPPLSLKDRVNVTQLKSPALANIRSDINAQLQSSRTIGRRKILFIDGIDFLLAASHGDPHNAVDVADLLDVLFDFQEAADTVILTLSADSPLLHAPDSGMNGSTRTPLETAHAAFVMSAVHRAAAVFSCRELDTGTARDVSGILRITHGGAAMARDPGRAGDSEEFEEGEFLYHVGGKGGVRVWRRGEGTGVG